MKRNSLITAIHAAGVKITKPSVALGCAALTLSASGFASSPDTCEPINPFEAIFANTTFTSSNGMSLADLDADGDLDLAYIGPSPYGGDYLGYFENIGTAEQPLFEEVPFDEGPFKESILDYVSYVWIADPHFIDIDNDGDLDFLYNYYGDYILHENIGTPTEPNFDFSISFADSFFFKEGNSSDKFNHENLEFADLDGDGDLDAFASGGTSGNQFLWNVGSASQYNFVAHSFWEEESWAGEHRPYVRFIDMDNDGDLDVFTNDEDDKGFVWFENIGTPETPLFANTPNDDHFLNLHQVSEGSFRQVLFADVNGDGAQDAITRSKLYKNQGTNQEPRFVASPYSKNPIDITITTEIEGIIPTNGDSVSVTFEMTNPTDGFREFDLWTRLTDGRRTLIDGPFAAQLAAGETKERTRTFQLTSQNPPGDYTYNIFLGEHRGLVYGCDSIIVAKE